MTLPIIEFLTQRMQEYDPTFEYRPGTAFGDLFIQPLSYIVQPIVNEAASIRVSQSVKYILELPDPNAYDEESVDSLAENLYVYRREGSQAIGVVRMLYQIPMTLNYIAGSLTFTGSDNLIYFNSLPVVITAAVMAGNIEEEFFYVDVAIAAQEPGVQFNAIPNAIVGVNDVNVIRVYNSLAVVGGQDKETNIELLNRVKFSIGTRDLNTGNGFRATMFENFAASLTAVQPIGFLDPEMMRDIYYNFHIGGQIDGWVKTNTILTGSYDVTAIQLDYTRITYTSSYVQMEGEQAESLGKMSIDESEQLLQGYNTDNAESAASFIGYADLTNGADLSVNRYITFSTETFPSKSVNISGVVPAETQAIEVVNAINYAFGTTLASYAANPTIVPTRMTGYSYDTSKITDPTNGIYYNVAVGDFLAVSQGDNKGTYTITAKISNNELSITPSLPVTDEGISYAITRAGTYIKVFSQTQSTSSTITLGDGPIVSTSLGALELAFGLPANTAGYTFTGQGQYAYVRDVHYWVDVPRGTASRIVGPTIVPTTSSGSITPGIYFTDATTDIFFSVQANDILTIFTGTTSTDYRIYEVVDYNTIRVDSYFDTTSTGVQYEITRTGIKNLGYVLYEFGYNPMSIDVGGQVELDEYGRVLGVRPGRETTTIVNTAFLYIISIEILDGATNTPTGEVLDGTGGYGQGGYGRGGYGVGAKAQYVFVINEPTLRYSALEDSMIIIDTAYLGENLRVNYRYVPEVDVMHEFANDDANRILDANVLIRHYIPALVSMHVTYTTFSTEEVSNDEVQAALISFINKWKGSDPIDASDVIDVILETVDGTRTKKVSVITPFTMRAVIYNTDGTTSIVSSTGSLQIPNDTIPPYTTAPLSPRTAHWIAGDVTTENVT